MTAPDDPACLEGWIKVEAAKHEADVIRGGCVCGFVAWSAEHVALMAFRAVAAEHLASVVSRRDADLRTRIEASDRIVNDYIRIGTVDQCAEWKARALDGDTREDAPPAAFAPAPELVGRPRVFRAETEGVDRMTGSPFAVHEPECLGIRNPEEFAGQCDCRTIRMLVIEVLRAHLFDETARADALADQLRVARSRLPADTDTRGGP